MTLFFAENIDGQMVQLSSEESRHLASVLRLKAGDAVRVTDGKGVMCDAKVVEPNAKAAILKVEKRHENFAKRGYELTIAVAPTKNIDRYEWFLEKATEIGVDRVIPLLCEHSERKIVRLDRAEKVVLSAVKQSFKAFIPRVEELTRFEDFLNSLPSGSDRFIAHCDDAEEKVELKSVAQNHTSSIVLIGPEGDFSDAEVELAHKHGFKSVGLGRERLRTETAALYAVALFAIASLD